MPVPTLTPAFIIPEGIGGGISGGGGNVGATAAGVVAAGVIAGGLAVVAAPVVAGLAAKASILTAASPLGLLAVGTFLKGLEQLREWGLINYRPQPTVTAPAQGDVFNLRTGGDGGIWVTVDRIDVGTAYTRCDGSPWTNASQSTLAVNQGLYGVGVALVMNKPSRTTTITCGNGPQTGGELVPYISIRRADGTEFPILQGANDTALQSTQGQGSNTQSYVNIRVSTGGAFTPLQNVTQGQIPQGTRPQLFPPTLPDAPVLPRPAGDPVPLTPALPPPPDRRPLAPPVVIPRPGQQPARVPVPGPSPGPSPGPGPAPVPAQPAPLQVPGIGPLPLPAPLPVPVTPVEVVVVDGLPISGPGQAPAPNLVAIAQELGRLEKKNEILMQRPENGGLGEAAENSLLAAIRGLLEDLIRDLLNDVGGGEFQLVRPCQAPGGGDPLPPVVVPYSGGTNATMAVLAKLDGIAGLIQAHKDVGQPTCVTPVFGQEVTVHFESE